MKHRFFTALLAGCLLLAAGCTREIPEDVQRSLEAKFSSSRPESSSAPEGTGGNLDPDEEVPPEDSASDIFHEPVISTAVFKAVGDNLIHNTIYLQAQSRATGEQKYDFYPAYEKIAPPLEGADFAFINQETLLASAVFEPSNYPKFNSPTEVGDTMRELGFNLFAHANNHALDMGVKGINATLDYWDNKEGLGEDFLVTGLFRDEADMNRVRVMEKNGISLALVAFTEHTNGLKLPDTVDNKIIYTKDIETIKRQIETAREAADVVVVSVHWGIENSHEVVDAQKELAQQMFDWGADIILGTHPHVLQPIEPMTSSDGTRKGYIIYSLGNFISAQNVPDNLVGGILEFAIEKNMDTGEISIGKPSLTPIVTHYETAWQKNLTLYPLADYTDELADVHGVKTMRNGYPSFSVEYIWNMLDDTIGEEYLQRELPAPPEGEEDEGEENGGSEGEPQASA